MFLDVVKIQKNVVFKYIYTTFLSENVIYNCTKDYVFSTFNYVYYEYKTTFVNVVKLLLTTFFAF